MAPDLVIANHEPLDEGFVPDSLTARESQINEVTNSLRSFLVGGSPLHVLLHGKPVTGKTAISGTS